MAWFQQQKVMSMDATRGELEASFTRAMIQMEKEYLGRGPEKANTMIIGDMVIVRLQGILTRAEIKLAESEHGRELIKETRRQLFESAREQMEEMTSTILGCNLVSVHTDVSTKSGERVIVLIVDVDMDKQF
ncbi:MAG: DUF2294 domain-containing protein [Chloroflexota bacterium]